MTIFHGMAIAIGRIRPLEMSLVILNLCLLALIFSMLSAVTDARSLNIGRYVEADLIIDEVLSRCLVESYR
jgi:hypothetical protein